MNDAADLLSQFLPQLLDLIGRSDIREIELREGDMSVRLHRAAPVEVAEGTDQLLPPAGEDERDEPEPTEYAITSPLVGTFYRAGDPGTGPLVSEGSRVQDDTVVGIIEALNVLTEVEAGCTGMVAQVLATDGQPVEFGQVLFTVNVRG